MKLATTQAEVLDYNKLTAMIIQEMVKKKLFWNISSAAPLRTSCTQLSPNVASIQTRIDTTSMVFRAFPKKITNKVLFQMWHFGDESRGIKNHWKTWEVNSLKWELTEIHLLRRVNVKIGCRIATPHDIVPGSTERIILLHIVKFLLNGQDLKIANHGIN